MRDAKAPAVTRVIARKDGAKVRLYSRPGNDLTSYGRAKDTTINGKRYIQFREEGK
jgi:ATP-dependent DNA ligase